MKTFSVIIENKCRCKKCGDVLFSRSVRDFIQCRCKAIFNDGGNEYKRRGGNKEDIEEMSKEVLFNEHDLLAFVKAKPTRFKKFLAFLPGALKL